jgi:maltose alpha-D-glucosyltransferase / alpha-amylase
MALARGTTPAFVPEPLTPFYQRSIEQSVRKLAAQAFQLLQHRAESLPEIAVEAAHHVLERQNRIHELFQSLLRQRTSGQRIRCHGNYHLGKILHAGKDFLIVDFEGDPTQEMAARRIKRSPLRDVACLLRSFHYVMLHVLLRLQQTGMSTPEALAAPQAALEFWRLWSSSALLRSYAATVAGSGLIPEVTAQRESLLHFHLLQRAMEELVNELQHRPHLAIGPLRGLLELS